MNNPFLSIVIPAHNEEHRLPATLNAISGFLESQPYLAEVIVVENGSQDRTFAIAQEYASSHPGFQVSRENQRGKGLAVRCGMLQAKGEYRFMCDADLSMPIEEINNLLPAQPGKIDVAIASREAPGAVRFNEPNYRHLGGRAINLMIRTLILPGLQDTQCGFKCFRAAVAEDLFSQQTLTGWSFDIEILFIARKRGYNIVEIPIHWYFDRESKLNAFSDALKMFTDILQIRRNDYRGVYGRA